VLLKLVCEPRGCLCYSSLFVVPEVVCVTHGCLLYQRLFVLLEVNLLLFWASLLPDLEGQFSCALHHRRWTFPYPTLGIEPL